MLTSMQFFLDVSDIQILDVCYLDHLQCLTCNIFWDDIPMCSETKKLPNYFFLHMNCWTMFPLVLVSISCLMS